MKFRTSLVFLFSFSLICAVSTKAQQQNTMGHDSMMMQHQMNQPDKDKLNIAVLVYNGALLLDYGIAAEMLLGADFPNKFRVYTVSRDTLVSLSIIGPMKPNYLMADAPHADVIIVPGGPYLLTEGGNVEIKKYLQNSLDNGSILFSVCTGSVLLAKAGMLENRSATSNHQALSMLKQLSPMTEVVDSVKFVDDGNIVTAAGAGTAIEATLHLIERLVSKELAEDMRQRYLNYPYSYEP